MKLENILKSLKDISNEYCKIQVHRTGIKYNSYPKPPYTTDIFLIKDKKRDIQYEIYAINVNGTYEIDELMKLTKNEIITSIGYPNIEKELRNKIEIFLEKYI